MSFRKEQEAARARAAEPINLGRGKIWFNVESTPGVSPDLSRAAEDLGRRVGEDIVHRMFAEAQRQEARTAAAKERLYSFQRAEFDANNYETFYWEGPGTGWTPPPPYNWKEDPACTDPFRVLPDGTIDLHPSQWSVIA